MTAPYYADDQVALWLGDALEVLCELPDASVDAVVTDPPYGLEFMGKEWDSPWKHNGAVIKDPATERGGFQDGNGGNPYSRSRIAYGRGGEASLGFQQWCEAWATECLRVLKPGGHMLAFGGTRTWHRLACAVEDAGFEVRDSIAWLYGSGFPKSLDVSKAIDKAAGAEREVVGDGRPFGRGSMQNRSRVEAGYRPTELNPDGGVATITAPSTDAARAWQGWGTALKPAFEPIVVARKPLVGTVAANVLAHGTGALNVDRCRIDGEPVVTFDRIAGDRPRDQYRTGTGENRREVASGRWPANVILDESQAAELDEQSGESASTSRPRNNTAEAHNRTASMGGSSADWITGGHDDHGGASRFFYVAKADASERVRIDGTAHPTVKPLTLMRWLVRLVTPSGGVVLEPFAGSGTTVEACILEGFRCIAIEREADYLPLIRQRIDRRRDPVAAVLASAPEDGGLFDLLGEDAS